MSTSVTSDLKPDDGVPLSPEDALHARRAVAKSHAPALREIAARCEALHGRVSVICDLAAIDNPDEQTRLRMASVALAIERMRGACDAIEIALRGW